MKRARVVTGADIDSLCRTTEFLSNCLPQPKGCNICVRQLQLQRRHPQVACGSILFQSKPDGWLLVLIRVGRLRKLN